jgi:hypothetical protein
MTTLDPVAEFGSAKQRDRDRSRSIPSGVSSETVEALGVLSEALEVVEDARGKLYGFHRLCGTADLTLQRGIEQLRKAGHQSLADEFEEVLVGRGVVGGLWSYQLVEDYDANYWSVFRAMLARARQEAGDVPMHLHEALMQYDEQHRPSDR